MLKKSSLGLFFVLTFAFAAFAQSAYTPAKGSPERAAIMNALRVPVERELKQKIQFSTDNFKIEGGWAFLNGTPQNTSGGKPNYRNTHYQTETRITNRRLTTALSTIIFRLFCGKRAADGESSNTKSAARTFAIWDGRRITKRRKRFSRTANNFTLIVRFRLLIESRISTIKRNGGFLL